MEPTERELEAMLRRRDMLAGELAGTWPIKTLAPSSPEIDALRSEVANISVALAVHEVLPADKQSRGYLEELAKIQD